MEKHFTWTNQCGFWQVLMSATKKTSSSRATTASLCTRCTIVLYAQISKARIFQSVVSLTGSKLEMSPLPNSIWYSYPSGGSPVSCHRIPPQEHFSQMMYHCWQQYFHIKYVVRLARRNHSSYLYHWWILWQVSHQCRCHGWISIRHHQAISNDITSTPMSNNFDPHKLQNRHCLNQRFCVHARTTQNWCFDSHKADVGGSHSICFFLTRWALKHQRYTLAQAKAISKTKQHLGGRTITVLMSWLNIIIPHPGKRES